MYLIWKISRVKPFNSGRGEKYFATVLIEVVSHNTWIETKEEPTVDVKSTWLSHILLMMNDSRGGGNRLGVKSRQR